MHRRVIEDLLRLVDATEAFHRNAEIKRTLQEARSILVNLHKRLSKPRYVLAMVGLSNVGKSTLLNALLGHDLAPRRNGPCTSAPIEFHHGQKLRVVARRRGAFQQPPWECSSAEDVHRVLSEQNDDDGAVGGQGIGRFEVYADLPLLEQGLVISDTPGFGAGQFGASAGSHEAALKSYLEQEVSQVLWVIRAEQGITAREMQFHDEWIASICDEILVTGCEGWGERDRERFRRRFSEAFKKRLAPTFHFVSGLEGLAARKANDSARLEQSGICALEAFIRTPCDRLAAIDAKLQNFANDLGCWWRELRDSHGQPTELWWHPPTWAWWLSQQPENQFKNRIARDLAPHLPAHA
jgi:hypothetical protein